MATFSFEEAAQPSAKTFSFEDAKNPLDNPKNRPSQNPSFGDIVANLKRVGSETFDNASQFAGGAIARLPDIGNNVMNAITYLPGKIFPGLAQANSARDVDYQSANKDLQIRDFGNSTGLTKLGGLATDIGATAGVGPALGLGAKAVGGAAPSVVNALTSGGFRTGAALKDASLGAKAIDLGTRTAAAGAVGAGSGAIASPENIGTTAAISAALPIGAKVAGILGSTPMYGYRAAKSLVQPFTESGQSALANGLIDKFAEGGPTALNMTQYVPGSSPTLAEATGNAGIARLQSAARDLRPNAFVDLERNNSAARNAAFDDVAGDAGKLDFYKASRSQAANDLYGQALDQANQQPLTPYIKGQITQLLKRPTINDLSKDAQRLAMDRGEKPSADGSLQALHDIKTGLDDKISKAVRDGQGGEAKALGAIKDKLLDVMEKISPAYGEARLTYAQMSQPVNQMEVLQGLKLTDATGNITLSKVQNALDGIQRKMTGPGTDAAKSLTGDQLNVLQAIRDDLLRQSNLNAGKSAGSNTFQNIATDNIVSTLLPGKLGGYVAGKAGGVLGQIGQLAYSKPNEAIRNKLVDIMLDPSLRQVPQAPQQLSGVRVGFNRLGSGFNSLSELASPTLYRTAPTLVNSSQ